jgi:predicted ester cyclase
LPQARASYGSIVDVPVDQPRCHNSLDEGRLEGRSAMSVEENKELVRRWFGEIDKADPAIVAQYIADDYVDHNPPPYPGLPEGREGARRAFEIALTVFSDYQHEIHHLVAEGDLVVTHLTGYGRHTGEVLGIAATGKEVQMSGISVHRVEDGKLAEHWAQFDAFGLFVQLGSFPAIPHP